MSEAIVPAIYDKSKLDDKREHILELIEKGISKSANSKMLDIKYQTLCSYIKTRELVA